jgi:putative addiction module component (TIGR02574 family)
MDTGAQILEAALQLPPSERARLLEGILLSFEPENRQRIDQLWAREAEDRIDAYDRGELGSVPAEDVFAEVLRARGQ